MNKLKRIIELRKLIENEEIDRDQALKELKCLIASKTNKISENEFYLKELSKIKRIRNIKMKLLNEIEILNNDSEDVKNLLILNDDDLKKLKKIGYKLL